MVCIPGFLEASLSNLQAAQATYRAALAAVDVARKSLDETALVAPISGQVAQRLAQPGERLAVDARILEIVDSSRLELEAPIAAVDSLKLKLGQTGQLRIEGSPAVLSARLVRINPSAQAAFVVVPCNASSGVMRNKVQAMFIASVSEVMGDEPGLQSVATAMGTPAWRRAAMGGSWTSRKV